MDVSKEEKENDFESGSDSGDLEGEEDCEITNSGEQEPAQTNASALKILVASSQKHGAFDSTFSYQ